MLGSLQCLAEASDEGLGSGSSSILVGWSLCDLGHQSPLSDPSFYPKDEDGILSPNLPSGTSEGTPTGSQKDGSLVKFSWWGLDLCTGLSGFCPTSFRLRTG